jgi:hypothetical protein
MARTDARLVDLYVAKVLLAEAARRRSQRAFHATLLLWAGNARRRAAEKPQPWQFSLWPEDAA